MNKILPAALAIIALAASPQSVWAQSEDQEASLFLGYSYLSVDDGLSLSGGSYGFIGDYTYYLNQQFGFAFSTSAHWDVPMTVRDAPNTLELDGRQLTFLAGPHASLLQTSTTELGVRGLIGAAWRTADSPITGNELVDDWAFAAGAELSLDFRLLRRVWLRAVQPAAVWTQFGDGLQLDWRLSTGIVIQSVETLR